MIIKIRFPRDPKRLVRGFVEKAYEVPIEVVRDMFETFRRIRNINRAVDVVCSWLAYTAGEEWCRAMGTRTDDCIIEYVDKQGERIRQQCEVAVRAWLVTVHECVTKCDLNVECISRCLDESTRS